MSVGNRGLDWKGNYEDMGKEHWNGNVDMDGPVSLEMDVTDIKLGERTGNEILVENVEIFIGKISWDKGLGVTFWFLHKDKLPCLVPCGHLPCIDCLALVQVVARE